MLYLLEYKVSLNSPSVFAFEKTQNQILNEGVEHVFETLLDLVNFFLC